MKTPEIFSCVLGFRILTGILYHFDLFSAVLFVFDQLFSFDFSFNFLVLATLKEISVWVNHSCLYFIILGFSSSLK